VRDADRRVAAAAIDPQKSNGASLAQKRPKFPGISPAVPDIVFPTLNKQTGAEQLSATATIQGFAFSTSGEPGR
jgi:hypothetical protein